MTARSGYDTIVVGLGAMGSATLYHLAKRGQRVLGVEQFTPGHTNGSSHGDSRIIREQYFEHPLYVPLAQRADAMWRELEGLTYRSLLKRTGGLMIGPADGEVVAGTLQSAREHGLPHEVLDAEQMHERFPAFSPRAGLVGAYDPRAGMLDADACNAAHLELARAKGATVRTEEPVIGASADEKGVSIRTARGTYVADKLVITAGAWTGSLMKELDLPLRIERETLFWFEPEPRALYEPDRFPIFCYEFTPGQINFGLARTGRGVKAGIHHSGEFVDHPDDVKRTVDPSEVELLRETLADVLPGLATAPVRETGVCLYTNTPDDHFIIDWHPKHPNILLSSPCSGHGFKFATVLGEAQASLITTGRSDFDFTPFRINRFATSGRTA